MQMQKRGSGWICLKDVNKPIGVSDYEAYRSYNRIYLKYQLATIEQLEGRDGADKDGKRLLL